MPGTIAPILAFIVVAIVLVLTPGIGTTFLIGTVASDGRRAGYLTAAGMVIGAAIHATIAATGTAILLREFPEALSWIAIVGGAYIVLLGALGILRALRPPAWLTASPFAAHGSHTFTINGVLIALGNAPISLFYFVVVPQYIPQGMTRLGGAALLSGIHLVLAGSWMTTLVTILGGLVAVLRRPRVLFGLQLASGIVLVLLGVQSIHGAT